MTDLEKIQQQNEQILKELRELRAREKLLMEARRTALNMQGSYGRALRRELCCK